MKPHFLQSTAWEEYQHLEGAETFYLEEPDFSARLILKSTPVGNYLFAPYGPTLRGVDPRALHIVQPNTSHSDQPGSPNSAQTSASDPTQLDISLPPELKAEILQKLQSALTSLAAFAQQHNAIFVRIEPTFPVSDQTNPTVDSESTPNPSPIDPTSLATITPHDLEKLGLKKSIDLDPAHTWIIDLTQPEETILKQMRGSNVQYWRSSSKKSLTVRQSHNPEEITILSSLLRGVANKDNFTPQDETHLRHQLEAGLATLYIAEYQQPSSDQTQTSNTSTNTDDTQSQPQTTPQVLAASLVYDDGNTRFYAHAATSDAERKLAAGTVLLVQMILDAKSNGTKFFDFWGVTTSQDKSHPWYGFTQYKKSFGGNLVTYAGTWDLPVNRSRYRLYHLIRKLNRLKRKIWK